ncbi:MAG: hypothetical protein JNK85_19845 [Verrucomicrobiales bacterium]|nr:hypothetical protein [Verrucomicrobiales bacterium]
MTYPFEPRRHTLASIRTVLAALGLLVVLIQDLTRPSHAAIVLPIEVIGTNLTTESVSVVVPGNPPITSLRMQIHGLTLANKASVQVNSAAWVNLNNTTVAVDEPGKSYGGIGGGFGTLNLTLKLAAGVAKSGTNTIRFRFNDVTRASIGYRVLRFNFLANGTNVLPESTFVADDPRTWKAPLTNATSVAEGRNLWYTRPLVVRGDAIQARCTDCHAHDGRDLKYFNYSNKSIIERSKFHGLTPTEAQKIASYIRMLNVPYAAKGRPWNPPYQPGPGLDAAPVRDWAAGAGLSWVLSRDDASFDYMFTNGITAEQIAFKSMINAREIPLAIQFPDWNHWLPEVHPKDAWGATFTKSKLNTNYTRIRGMMSSDKLLSARRIKTLSQEWYTDAVFFFGRDGTMDVPEPAKPWPLEFQVNYNSTMHWRLTKFWEIITEFQLEDMGVEVLGAHANDRTWYDSMLFNTGPHFMHLTKTGNPINDGSINNWDYFSAIWYQLQVTLNNSNKRPSGTDPIDWAYLHAFAGRLASKDVGSAAVMTLNLVTAAQSLENGKGPRSWGYGWEPVSRANLHFMAPEPHFPYVWKQVPAARRKLIAEAYLKNWIEKTASYPVDHYYYSDDPRWNGAFARPNEVLPTPINPTGGRWIERYWPLAKNFRKLGVDEVQINRLIDFGKALWPLNDWDSLRAPTVALAESTPESPLVPPRAPTQPTGFRVVAR